MATATNELSGLQKQKGKEEAERSKEAEERSKAMEERSMDPTAGIEALLETIKGAPFRRTTAPKPYIPVKRVKNKWYQEQVDHTSRCNAVVL
jgi:hypothetical protein